MVAWSYLRWGDVDVANDARTHAYSGGVLKCSGCDDLAVAAGAPESGYTNPLTDRAPWTVGNNNGGCFFGLTITDLTGVYDAARRLTVTEKLGRGGTPTAGRYGSRTMGVTARALASSEAGMNAGLEWLTQVLTGPPCDSGDCAGVSAHFFDECPVICDGLPDTNSTPVTAILPGGPDEWTASAGTLGGTDPETEWTGTDGLLTYGTCLEGLCGPVTLVYDVTSTTEVTGTVAVVPLDGTDAVSGTATRIPASTPTELILIVSPTPEFPDCFTPLLNIDGTSEGTVTFTLTQISQTALTPEQQVSRVRRRYDGVVVVDGPKEISRVVLNSGVFSVVEWTMVATDPYLYRDPRPIWEGQAGDAPVFLAAGVDLFASNAAFAEISCTAPSSSITTCADNPACPPLLSPPEAPTVPGCDPVVSTWDRQWMEISSQVIGSGEAVLTGTLTNQTGFAQTARIRVYHADDVATECAFIQEMWIDYIPPAATVTIGEGGQVLMTCTDGEIVNATRNIRGNYRGPHTPLVLGCTRDWVVAFDVAGTDTTHEWDVSLVNRTG